MVLVNVPYIKKRKNRDGTFRHYWVRPGFPVVRLPDEETERIDRARAYNKRASSGKMAPKQAPHAMPIQNPAMLAYWVREYLQSDDYKRLAKSTQNGWKLEANRFTDAAPAHPIDETTEQFVRRYLHTIPTPGRKSLARNAIRAVLANAVMAGALERNPALGIRVTGIRHRDRSWEPDEIDAFLAEVHPITLAGFTIALHTGQRIQDVLAMTWADYDGEFIRVYQRKGRKKIDVYCHSDLRAFLDALKQERKGTRIIAHDDGREVTYNSWAYRFAKRRAAVGLQDIRTHDLRRTAAMLLKDAGNDIRDVAAVTGHSTASIQMLCETYLPHTRQRSKAAVQRLEEFQREKREGRK